MPKELVRGENAPKKISQIQFALLSPTAMQRVAEFQVFNPELFRLPERTPVVNGSLDPRLGVSDKDSLCQTCRRKIEDCAGHFGYIQLELPIFHIGYFKHCLTILQCICKTCSRVLLDEQNRALFLKRIRNPNLGALQRAALFKKIVELAKKCSKCPYDDCGAINGKVKKVSQTLRLVHEKFKAKGGPDAFDDFRRELDSAASFNQDIAAHANKAQEDLTPQKIVQLFHKMPDQDCELLWLDPRYGRPEHLLLKTLLVPPVPIRPSVAMDVGGGSTEDGLTTQLSEIIRNNNLMQVALNKGASVQKIIELWDFVQMEVSKYINADAPGLPREQNSKPLRGLCQRLKGKSGRFRGNLSGKRVDFSGRTVISPDPNLAIDQVGVPLQVAKTMTYPERVNNVNIEVLRAMVVNGATTHPGANVIRPADPRKYPKTLIYANLSMRKKLAEELRVGDIVERHMMDGDIVLFNRQPSLHKLSIMAHRVKAMPWRTFRFNESVCSPYNADFDGDEMNMHLPQTEEARTEAACLMGVTANLVTPRNGEPVVAATQDFITGAYLVTSPDVFFTRSSFFNLLAYLGDANEHIDVPPPAILKPRELWAGKQVISMLVRPNKEHTVMVNLENKERNYVEGSGCMCPNDGYVIFRSSELICGNLGKKTVGTDGKSGLFYVLLRDHGAANAARCMNRLAKFCARYIGYHRGFSIGIDDVTPSEALARAKDWNLKNAYAECAQKIKDYEEGKLQLQPGCNLIETLEDTITGVLGKVRDTLGKEALVKLDPTNSPRMMADCGSKGAGINISQMISVVGQQVVNGKRIENGFVNRTLPHFEPGALSPEAKGFVASSFFTGMSATEFFMHTMAGREGLVDTAVKTAETGYMARRLMKALEDLFVHYDSSIRNSEQSVVQFTYGDDGLDPTSMENGDRPVNFSRLMPQVMHSMPCAGDDLLSPAEIVMMGDEAVRSPEFQRFLPWGEKFLDEIRGFCTAQAEKLWRLYEAVGLPSKDYRITWTSYQLNQKLAPLGKKAREAWQVEASIKGTQENRQVYELLVSNAFGLTRKQLSTILSEANRRYNRCFVEPGEAVGAIGAQSLSEPGTQMTLKTFHFAGVASMNVTLGVPRLKEIINASKQISTPIITAVLVNDKDPTSARAVKAGIEKTTIGEVAEYIREVYAPNMCFIEIKLDLEAIEKLHLRVDANSVRRSILKGGGGQTKPAVLRQLKDNNIFFERGREDKLVVTPPEWKDSRSSIPYKQMYFVMQALKAALPDVIIEGIPTLSRAIINVDDQKMRYNLLIEGYGLAEVMGANGVDGTRCTSNNIIEIEKTLGIEAARTVISTEISLIMSVYGIRIDKRHLMLLSDVMTFKGEVLGITRFGVAKMRESVLMLASFEKTTDHLFDAAVHGRTDEIVGVSECIIMGIPIPLGTGLFKLLRDVEKPKITSKTPLLKGKSGGKRG